MKKNNLTAIFLLLTALVFSANFVFAQNENNKGNNYRGKMNKSPEEIATKMSDRMKKNLNLSEDQYKQVYNLILEKANDRIANKEKYKSMDKDSRKLLKQQNREIFNTQIESILNKDQIEKLQQLKSKHKGKKGKHNGGNNNNSKSETQN